MIKSCIRKLFKKKALARIIKKGKAKRLPVYIISYNRLSYLKQTIEWLEGNGYTNLKIVDNHSDNKALLDYLNSSKYKVIRMPKNQGHKVFYKCARFFWTRTFGFYYLTDPDLHPIETCQSDFGEQFVKVMYDYPNVTKVGFSLKIDDLPENPKTENLIEWEKQYFMNVLAEHDRVKLYSANIDTTFALTSPSIFSPNIMHNFDGIRLGEPYQARHLPWYIEENDDETEHYRKTQICSTWFNESEQ